MMAPEVYLLRYAFPCSHILLNIRKEISEEDYKKMEVAALEGIKLDRKFLERVFFRAFQRMQKIADELGKDKWDIDIIKEYFCKRHNAIVNSSDNPDSFKDMCKVHEGKVIEIADNFLIVKYKNKKERKVKIDYVRGVKVGEKVRIHYNYAIEKV